MNLQDRIERKKENTVLRFRRKKVNLQDRIESHASSRNINPPIQYYRICKIELKEFFPDWKLISLLNYFSESAR